MKCSGDSLAAAQHRAPTDQYSRCSLRPVTTALAAMMCDRAVRASPRAPRNARSYPHHVYGAAGENRENAVPLPCVARRRTANAKLGRMIVILLVIAVVSALTAPPASIAQSAGTVFRIGLLDP